MTTTTDTKHITVRCQFCAAWNRIDAARAADRPKCGKCGTPIRLDRPLKLDADSFHRTIEDSELPVLVDFYADWCGPCKMMAPLVDELAAEYQGRALIAKLDTDRAPAIQESFQVRGIPTTIVFRNGKEAKRRVGAVPKAALEELLKD
jgi:thioredoxin 2